jgi:hypothetical protein
VIALDQGAAANQTWYLNLYQLRRLTRICSGSKNSCNNSKCSRFNRHRLRKCGHNSKPERYRFKTRLFRLQIEVDVLAEESLSTTKCQSRVDIISFVVRVQWLLLADMVPMVTTTHSKLILDTLNLELRASTTNLKAEVVATPNPTDNNTKALHSLRVEDDPSQTSAQLKPTRLLHIV